MRTRRILTAINWKYALGEIALIFIGITLALAASAWYEGRQERLDEILILEQFKKALEVDYENLVRIHETYSWTEASASALLDHLSGGEPYNEDVQEIVAAAAVFRTFEPNTAVYEALKSRGFDLISNEELRYELINYYELSVRKLTDSISIDQDFVLRLFTPYRLENFRGFVPLDYERLRRDVHFENFVRLKSNRVSVFLLPQVELAIEKNEVLKELLDSQLPASD